MQIDEDVVPHLPEWVKNYANNEGDWIVESEVNKLYHSGDYKSRKWTVFFTFGVIVGTLIGGPIMGGVLREYDSWGLLVINVLMGIIIFSSDRPNLQDVAVRSTARLLAYKRRFSSEQIQKIRRYLDVLTEIERARHKIKQKSKICYFIRFIFSTEKGEFDVGKYPQLVFWRNLISEAESINSERSS